MVTRLAAVNVLGMMAYLGITMMGKDQMLSTLTRLISSHLLLYASWLNQTCTSNRYAAL
jgi:hypothetical protein